jgi:hypothetical protein
MLTAVRILTAALIVTGVAHPARAQPVEYDLAIDAAASLSDPGAGGELSAFAPLLYEDDHLLFGDFRAGGVHDEFFNLSFGWGGRRLLPSEWIAGWSFYLDRTRVDSDDKFDQVGFGLEWLSVDWDVRINGYLADTTTYYRGPSRAVIRNNTMLVEHPLIGANSGTDFEIGYLLGDWKNGAVDWRRRDDGKPTQTG